VLGVDVRNVGDLRGRLTILPQDAQFQANVPARDQLVFMARLAGMSPEAAERDSDRVLAIVGMTKDARKNARTLSHGMTKRLGIAQALLGSPEVIILDEPTAGLDPAHAADIRTLVRDVRRGASHAPHDDHLVARSRRGRGSWPRRSSSSTRVGWSRTRPWNS